MKKSFLKSKSFWLGALTFVGSFVPSVQDFIVANPATFSAVWGVIAVLARTIKSDLVLTE